MTHGHRVADNITMQCAQVYVADPLALPGAALQTPRKVISRPTGFARAALQTPIELKK